MCRITGLQTASQLVWNISMSSLNATDREKHVWWKPISYRVKTTDSPHNAMTRQHDRTTSIHYNIQMKPFFVINAFHSMFYLSHIAMTRQLALILLGSCNFWCWLYKRGILKLAKQNNRLLLKEFSTEALKSRHDHWNYKINACDAFCRHVVFCCPMSRIHYWRVYFFSYFFHT